MKRYIKMYEEFKLGFDLSPEDKFDLDDDKVPASEEELEEPLSKVAGFSQEQLDDFSKEEKEDLYKGMADDAENMNEDEEEIDDDLEGK
jgi:hypothetical protein